MTYNRINNITGWAVFAIATLTYWLTVEPTASYWDCGEFIAVSFKLMVPHPPGAPLFLLIGRLFSMLSLGDVERVAYWINISSVLASGFTILFLFWSITLLGRKVYGLVKGEEPIEKTWLIMGAGAVGALAYTFSDSFWFSAVEAEVYAMSSFFTAWVFWAILKWEVIEDEQYANKWLIFIAYMMGLSIGVHLLNLVTIPALGLIYYFKKYSFSWQGVMATLVLSGAIIIIILEGIIPGLPSLAGSIEVYLVNSLGLPFNTGFILFLVLFLGGLIYSIYITQKKQWVTLNTIVLAFTVILIGYSSYTMVLIRSNYNPPIDENNPENMISFVSYLKREQYGSRPLFKGQYFDAQLTDQKKSGVVYVKGEKKYEVADIKLDPVYDRNTILPRIYSNTGNHPDLYREKLGLRPGQKPTFADNIKFLFSHQLGHMYWRYFMWNFVGRDSDFEGASWINPFESKADLPETFAENGGRNNFWMLPFIIGLLGLFFQLRKHQKDFAVVGMLFFLTGIALVLYLNSPPVEPRERDYIYVGSFYAFAIWIGFGVFAIAELLEKIIKNGKALAAIATIICLLAPTLMAKDGWDDHDRSNRYFSVDSAKNFLASCAPNAILFTGGDNDTFPLWYAQEVEGFRTDVRVIVLSYFNTDWYIEQMTRPAYESEPLKFSLDKSHYRQGGFNDYLPFVENPSVRGNAVNLQAFFRLIKDNNPNLRVSARYAQYNSIPAKNFFMDVDTEDVISRGLIPAHLEEKVLPRMTFTVKGGGLEKKDLMILNLIAENNWERPIYFNNTSLAGVGINFNNYVVQEGTTFRLLPIQSRQEEQAVDVDKMYDNVMNKFSWRGLDDPSIYHTEDYRNFVYNHRSSLNTLAEALIALGDRSRAKEVIDLSLRVMPDKPVLYDFASVETVRLLFRLGEDERAMEIAEVIAVRSDENLGYMLDKNKPYRYERAKSLNSLNYLSQIMREAGKNDLAADYQQRLMQHYGRLNGR